MQQTLVEFIIALHKAGYDHKIIEQFLDRMQFGNTVVVLIKSANGEYVSHSAKMLMRRDTTSSNRIELQECFA
jgi:hypothetical protein